MPASSPTAGASLSDVNAQTGPGSVRGLTKRWLPRSEHADAEPSPGEPLIERILRGRGLAPDRVGTFVDPSLKSLHDPGLLPDVDRASRRMLDAAAAGEPIVIFGDYDVDGVTASSILIHMIRSLVPGADVRGYIPHRVEEGYGLNADAIRALIDEGARLIVSVDCGITAHEPAAVAKQLGVDLIITDHHNPPATMDELPDAFAVVHPRRPDSAYPWGELCGAGVAYKLAWRMATMHAGGRSVSPASRSLLLELLGLAALGTIADVVPLHDENRVIGRFGLTNLAHTRNPGIRALIHASGLDSGKVDAEDVGFRLAPRLNAVGRLGHAREALELLTEAKGSRADELAEQLSRLNSERRAVEQRIVEQACAMAEAEGMAGDDTRAIVLRHPDWHPGVIGIACSRLVEKFGRPVILMQHDGDTCKGSARSIDGFNLHGALEHCAASLTRFGGHDMAAGMACSSDRFDDFRTGVIAYVNERLTAADLVPSVRYDAGVRLGELSVPDVNQIERLAPFGAGNPRVRLRVRGKIAGAPKVFGGRGDHMSVQLLGERSVGVRVVGWNWATHADQIPPGATIEAIVEPKLSDWGGRTSIEPVLVDLRVLDGDASGGVVVRRRPASAHSVGAEAKVPERN